MDYAFAFVVSLDCNNSNGLWMYCIVCVDFGHELCVKWCICHCFVELYICYAL